MAATAFLTPSEDRQRMRAERAHARHLRSWRFQIFVLLATLAAGLLAYLGKTVGQLPLDLELTRWTQGISTPGVYEFLHAVSWIGYPPQSNYIWGTVIVLLFLIGWRMESFGFFMAAAGSAILWLIIVPLVDRPRPSPELVRVATELPTGSYPSGHVLNLTAIFGFLMFIAIQKIENVVVRRVVGALLAVPILFVGISRVYDGAHWPSDVLGGYLIGGIWLALSIGVYQEIRSWLARRRERQTARA